MERRGELKVQSTDIGMIIQRKAFTYHRRPPLRLASLMDIEMRVLELVGQLIEPLKGALTALLWSMREMNKLVANVCL